MTFTVENRNANAVAEVTERDTGTGLRFVDFSLRFSEPTVPAQVTVKCNVPITDMWSIFSSMSMYQRNIAPSWNKRVTPSRLASGAPLCQMISGDNRNRLTVALSDAANPTEIAVGVVERTACLVCEVRFFTQPVNKITEYHAVIRLDAEDKRYEEGLKAAERWWAEECGYPSSYIPEIAREPLYSTWYSFHQDVNVDAIVHQCELAAGYGMKNVIVDDGWQLGWDQHGYVNCGDWQPHPDKVADMKDFVSRVHALGMKFTLWYHLPAFGTASAAHERFGDMLLNPSQDTWAAYDPRFPETRQYICDILANAIREWDLDGFKLDFIDSFKLRAETPAFDPRWDTLSLEDGVDKLLADITKSLREVKPEVMIEFRQFYFGPVIRKYGNMIRVGDCPNDSLRNHIAGTDLRFMLGKTPVHSDMLMWHAEDSVESAARQVISTLFLVPQISVLLDKIPEDHRKMLKFYLDFWCAHKRTLLDGNLTAENPEAGYSRISAEGEGELVSVAASLPVLTVRGDKTVYFVNSTAADRLYFRAETDLGKKRLTVYSVTGDVLSDSEIAMDAGVREVKVPVGGMAVLEKNV